MGTEIVVKNKINWNFYIILVLILISVSSWVYVLYFKDTTINDKSVLITEGKKIDLIDDDIAKLDSTNLITLTQIKEKKKELEKLEQELKKIDQSEMTIEEALKIINNE